MILHIHAKISISLNHKIMPGHILIFNDANKSINDFVSNIYLIIVIIGFIIFFIIIIFNTTGFIKFLNYLFAVSNTVNSFTY